MKKNTCLRIFSMIMTLVLLSGCGSTAPKKPELLEPLSVSSSYRPVEFGSIGNTKVYYGVIVAKDYCHYWKTSTTVADIKVDIGDQVTKGQVLAIADVKQAKETIEGYNSQIAYYQKEQELNEELYQWQLGELTWQKKEMGYINDLDGVKDFEKQIDVLTENHGFDLKLYALKIRVLKESIAEQQELIDHSQLEAKADGYVTFIKDISVTANANTMENIVIVSDNQDCHVELPNYTVDKLKMNLYDKYLTKIGDEECELQEYPYSDAEIAMAQSKGMFPNVRLNYTDKSKMPAIGMTIPVFMLQNVREHVLILGKDSIQEDDKGSFVYVKNGESRDIKYVELGDEDNFNVELISGLNEGDLVYYSAGTVLPENYASVEVKVGTYALTEHTESFKQECCINKGYSSEVEGRVIDNLVAQNAIVKKGDQILTINTNEGKAHLTELSNQITKLKDEYDKKIRDYDKEIEKLTKKLNQYETEMVEINISANSIDEFHDSNVVNCQINEIESNKKLEELAYNFNLQAVQKEYDKASKNNNGSGTVSVYADSDGELTSFTAVVGKTLHKGDRMFVIRQPASDKVVMLSKNSLSLNQKVSFAQEDGTEYTGYIIGSDGLKNEDSPKPYIETIDNKVFLSTCSLGTNTSRFYIRMEDSSFYQNTNKMVATYTLTSIDNSILIPVGAVYKEVDRVSQNQYWFVWKIEDGNLIKQYVLLADDNLGQEEVCVINGLKAGDVVANECVDVDTTQDTQNTDSTQPADESVKTNEATDTDSESTDSTTDTKESENADSTDDAENTENSDSTTDTKESEATDDNKDSNDDAGDSDSTQENEDQNDSTEEGGSL